MPAHGRSLRMPFSHDLPVYLKKHPYYDSLPARLSDFTRQKYGVVKVADIGANIGDTIAAFCRHEDDRFLAIEANPRFIKYLRHNFGEQPGVKIVECYCSSAEGNAQFTIREQKGTAEIVPGQGHQMRAAPLDILVAENGFSDLNLIKIDTDGYDLRVLSGAPEILKMLPAVLFEFYAWGEDCIRAWRDFLKTLPGYDYLLLYDQTGLLMGRHRIADFSSIADLLFYQAIDGAIYFDALLMRPGDSQEFFEKEREFFAPLTRLSPYHDEAAA
jgi:FkbM family methyltransferase